MPGIGNKYPLQNDIGIEGAMITDCMSQLELYLIKKAISVLCEEADSKDIVCKVHTSNAKIMFLR